MLTLKKYRGHIRNWEALMAELDIEKAPLCEDGQSIPDRQKREEAIILSAYRKWGADIAEHLYGMFAFAISDDETNELFAIRDQFGTKPFYYYVTKDGRLLYGTFIREIINDPAFDKEFNEEMLQIYLTLSYDGGEETFFKGLNKLLPGHHLTWKESLEENGSAYIDDKAGQSRADDSAERMSPGELTNSNAIEKAKAAGRLKIKRYWRPEFKADEDLTLDDFADEIHETTKEIMKEVIAENEEAESFLSGGVDSSYVLAMSNACAADTCGYEDERFDESKLAAETARLLNVDINRALIEPEDYFANVHYVMENMELPLGDASAIVFAIGCKETAKHAKICYSGEGSDEFFGGYNMYRNAERYGDNLKTFYVGNTNLMKEEDKQKLLKNYKPDVLPIDLVKKDYEEMEGYDPLTKMSAIDIKLWLEGDIYLNVDKMSEAAGLEIRMPLTDMRIFKIAAKMPSRYKVNEEQNKVAFRTAAAKVLPDEIAFRKKLGFIVPIRIWMADERYNADIKEKINGPTAERFFNMEEVKNIWAEYIGGNSDLWRKIWVIYTFIVWYDIYF